MNEYHVRLGQESGVMGPRGVIHCPPDPAAIEDAAREWADGQIGWPWDLLLVWGPNLAREIHLTK